MDKFPALSPAAENIGTVKTIGKELYTTYSFPFEAVSFILLAAIVGAIILAKKKFD
jgi:NADH-quinone oxidoreductase subunit J